MSTPPAHVHAATPGAFEPGTLTGLFLESVERWGARDAFSWNAGGVWRAFDHDELARRVRRLTRALETWGITQGDRVALLSENRPEWAIADYAILCAGAVVVPFYPNLPAAQIAPLLQDSGARMIFVSSAEQLAKVGQMREAAPALERIVVFDDAAAASAPAGGTELASLSHVLAAGATGDAGPASDDVGAADAFRARALAVRPDDLATIIYTSGTTGRPKGVMLTHDNLRSNVEATRRILPLSEHDTALSFLPLSHVFERMVDYVLFLQGCVIAFAESFERVPANLREVRPTIVASVPRLYEKIYARVTAARGLRGRLVAWARRVGIAAAVAEVAGRSPGLATRAQLRLADALVFRRLRAAAGGRIRFFISGGAPLEPEIAKFFYAAGMPVMEGYGLTETSPVTNVNTPRALRFGTVGRPVPGTDVRIAADGEILVRGPQVMKGYYGMPAETAEVLDAEGWFHTGDIGTLDADGFLAITDRKKDLIVTAGGKNVAPQPIENRVKTNRFVAEAVMLGDRRPFPILLVVPDFEVLEAWTRAQGLTAASREALLELPAVRQKMEQEVFGAVEEFARYERPKKIALLEREFSVERGELTPSLKVKRRVVTEHYASLIEALYESQRGEDVVSAAEPD